MRNACNAKENWQGWLRSLRSWTSRIVDGPKCLIELEGESSEKFFAKNIILTKNAGGGKYDSWS
jgi:hypothetical protein